MWTKLTYTVCIYTTYFLRFLFPPLNRVKMYESDLIKIIPLMVITFGGEAWINLHCGNWWHIGWFKLRQYRSSTASRCYAFQDGGEGRTTGMQTQGRRCGERYWYFAVWLHRSRGRSPDRSRHLHGSESSSIAAQERLSGKTSTLLYAAIYQDLKNQLKRARRERESEKPW